MCVARASKAAEGRTCADGREWGRGGDSAWVLIVCVLMIAVKAEGESRGQGTMLQGQRSSSMESEGVLDGREKNGAIVS